MLPNMHIITEVMEIVNLKIDLKIDMSEIERMK